MSKPFEASDYFLSDLNPLATLDQRDADELVEAVLASEIGRQAVARASFLWRKAFGSDGAGAEAWATFDDAMVEYARNYILKAVASDPGHPRIVQNFAAPHLAFGRHVPGSRMGGDNPDNVYRMVGIQPGRRYVLHVRQVGVPPAHVSFALAANWGTSKTIEAIESSQLVRDADGGFRITIDGEPANGRSNHLMTSPDVKLLFMRDSMMDWSIETPNAYRLEVLDSPICRPASLDQLALHAADIMADDVPLYYWFTRLASGLRPNLFEPVGLSGASGGLPTQAGTLANFRLADDDAVVITIDPAGADYCGIVAHDWHFRTIGADRRTSSLTTTAMRPNRDATSTLVMAITDPGVHNWLDVGGLHQTLVFCRWQGLPADQVRQGPKLRAEMVKIQDLPDLLPPDTAFVSAVERREQIDARAKAYDRRWAGMET